MLTQTYCKQKCGGVSARCQSLRYLVLHAVRCWHCCQWGVCAVIRDKLTRLHATFKTSSNIMMPALLQTTGKGKTPPHFTFTNYHVVLASLYSIQSGFFSTTICCYVSFYWTTTVCKLFVCIHENSHININNGAAQFWSVNRRKIYLRRYYLTTISPAVNNASKWDILFTIWKELSYNILC